MVKVDIKTAFRLCPFNLSDHHLQGMKWKGQSFFDRVLPFGLRSATFIFNCLAEAIEWAATQEGVIHTHHYLDEFFLACTLGLKILYRTSQHPHLTLQPPRSAPSRREMRRAHHMPRVPRNTPGLHSPGGPAATRQAGGQPQGTSPLGSPDPVQEVGVPVPHWDTELRCQGGASKTHLPQEDDRHRSYVESPTRKHNAPRGL